MICCNIVPISPVPQKSKDKLKHVHKASTISGLKMDLKYKNLSPKAVQIDSDGPNTGKCAIT